MLRSVVNKLLGRKAPVAPVQDATAGESAEELLASIDARWHKSEVRLQHARRRIADIVVTRRTLGGEVPEAVNAALDAAQAELQAAVDETALRVEQARRDAALLKTRAHIAETRNAIYELRDAMDVADNRMDETLSRVSDLIVSHESMVQARDELDR